MENIFRRFFKKEEKKIIVPLHEYDLENHLGKIIAKRKYRHPNYSIITETIEINGYACAKCGKTVWCQDEQKDNIKLEGCEENLQINEPPKHERKKRQLAKTPDPIRWYN